jgi:hypothetical protein
MGTHLVAAADMFSKDTDMSHLPEPITELDDIPIMIGRPGSH